MKNSDLQEILKKYPDDIDVLIGNQDFQGVFIDEFYDVVKEEVNYANYSTKWQNEIDYYSYGEEDFITYRDELNGKITKVTIPTTKKDVLLLKV